MKGRRQAMSDALISLSRDLVNYLKIKGSEVAHAGERALPNVIENVVAKSEWLQPFVESPIGVASDANYKRQMAVAIVKAVSAGQLPQMDANGIASLVDEGMTRLKLAYQVGMGVMDVSKASDILIDRAVGRTAAIVKNTINHLEQNAMMATEVGLPLLIDKAASAVCSTLTSVYPPAAALTPVIKAGAAYIKPKAVSAVKKGITVVARAARSLVSETVPKVTKWLQTKVRSIFS